MKQILKLLVAIFLHIGAISIILISFAPLAQWYFSANPLWGVDFYYTATLVRLLKLGFALPAGVWNHFWFAGWPMLSNYPILHYYGIYFLTFFADIFVSIKFWMIASAALFFIGIYATSYRLARDWIIATVITLAAIYSIGVYGALTWGGSLSSFASQAFYPWVIFFTLQYFYSHKSVYFRISILLTGLAILAHPQVVIAYIYPTIALLYFFTFEGTLSDRIKKFLVYFLLSFLIGLPLLYQNLSALSHLFVTDANKVAQSTATVPTTEMNAVQDFFRKQPLRMFTDTHPLVFVLSLIAVVLYLCNLIFVTGRATLKSAIPILAILIWYIVYIWMFSFGISIYHGGWYRLFWGVPLWFGMLTAFCWGSITQKRPVFLHLVGGVLFATVAVIYLVRPQLFGIYELTQPDIASKILNYATFGKDYYRQDPKEILAAGTLSLLKARSQPSSAYPDVLNMKTDSKLISELKQQIKPEWLDANNTNYRIYEADQTINIWWNALFDMPLARGYLDSGSPEQRGYIFWLDASLNQDPAEGGHQLVSSFNYPELAAKNNTLFLIDWYGIKYLEAGHAGPTVYSPVPEFLFEEGVYFSHHEKISFTEKYNTGGQELNYSELKDEYVGPILSSTHAPTLGIVASDQGYEVMVRALADSNLGVNTVIPVKLGRQLEDISVKDLEILDGLVLYDYNYHTIKQLDKVGDFVKQGKKLFIDTGIETKDSNSTSVLHELFPIQNTKREALGAEWEFEILDGDPLTADIDFSSFDPPMFDVDEWKFSFPESDESIREGAKILVKNHDKPLLIQQELGQGQVIWSGFNLPYHVTRTHNDIEVSFFARIIKSFIPEISEPSVADAVTFNSPLKRSISSLRAKGILFKELALPGWNAKIKSGNRTQRGKIYSVGPAHPGFMYVPIPESFKNQKIEVTFNYSGDNFKWLLLIISGIFSVLVIEDALGGFIINRHLQKILHKSRSQFKRWWGRDDES